MNYLTVQHSILFLILLLLYSCKNDNSLDKLSDKESIFFEDYESPMHKWGFLNTQGDLVIKNKYDDLRDFNEGLAQANLGGRWGFIDRADQVVVDFKFKTTSDFEDSKAIVTDFNNRSMIIDKQGKVLLTSDSLHSFIKIENQHIIYADTSLIGLKALDGKTIIKAQYKDLKFISPDLLAAKLYDQYTIINVHGKAISNDRYDRISVVSNGMIKVRKESKMSFLDISGNLLLSDYTIATDFHSSFAGVCKNDECYLIDKQGKQISESYDFINYGGRERWMIMKNGKFGFINNQGKLVIDANYDLVGRFKEGYAGFQQSELWGYLAISGEEKLPASFPLIWDFHNGLARYIGRSGVGFIDTNFITKVNPKYFEVRDFHEGLARVQVW